MNVRDIIKFVEGDGWYLVRTKGSHRQYKHSKEAGLGYHCRSFDERRFGTRDIKQYFETSRTEGRKTKMNRFLIVIEKAGKNFSAYSPDLPGCVATGATREKTEKNMHEAILMHVQGLREDNQPVPESSSSAEYIAV